MEWAGEERVTLGRQVSDLRSQFASAMTPAQVIDDIRHEQCVGQHADERVAGLKDKLARSVQRLSEDLYSSKTHCIMEIVQNADDNSYVRIQPDGSVVPSSPSAPTACRWRTARRARRGLRR